MHFCSQYCSQAYLTMTKSISSHPLSTYTRIQICHFPRSRYGQRPCSSLVTGTWPTTPHRSVMYFHVAKLKRQRKIIIIINSNVPQAPPCFSNTTYSTPAVVPNSNTTMESGSVRREPSGLCSIFNESEQAVRTRRLGTSGSSLSVILNPIWSFTGPFSPSIWSNMAQFYRAIALNVGCIDPWYLFTVTEDSWKTKIGFGFCRTRSPVIARLSLGSGDSRWWRSVGAILFRPHPCVLHSTPCAGI